MALNAAGLNALLEDGNDAVIYAAVGNGTGSGNQTSNQRVQLVFGTPSAGVITVTNVPMAFTGTPAAGATNLLLFSAPTAGTFYGFQAMTGDSAFNGSGDFQITGLTITGAGV